MIQITNKEIKEKLNKEEKAKYRNRFLTTMLPFIGAITIIAGSIVQALSNIRQHSTLNLEWIIAQTLLTSFFFIITYGNQITKEMQNIQKALERKTAKKIIKEEKNKWKKQQENHQ